MKDLIKLRGKYIDKFDDYFPNISLSEKREIEIIKDCLEKGKDAYQLGYFELEEDIEY